ncbi:SLAP domain-containing protein [Oceanobacillus saliphilus]|uniref:SLAP domain-containing protein n=1 Tax=Oceanobacillus saliphilus TaxID=2925834 RepID=UPI00201D6A30|nr:SLAP domain-containing protein [Oceanobacillus saliphilus]
MQKLAFEPSWDKALPAKDRQIIEEAFQNHNIANEPIIELTPLWQARNYRGELLITVLVHNFSHDVFSFNNTKLCYIENEEIIAQHTFTIPALTLNPEISMPWAFIFPVESIVKKANLENGKLEFIHP